MTTEAWRTALIRWGDSLFGLALLLTNQRSTAEAATIAAFCRVFSAAPPADPEPTLYAALVSQRRRWRQPRQHRVLSRSLAQIEPVDRLLLGAWLLRNMNGAQLAGIVGLPTSQVVARLAAVLIAHAPATDDLDEQAALIAWLEQQLNVPAAAAAQHEIQQPDPARRSGWQETIDRLRALLHEVMQRHHLPAATADAIEATLLEQQSTGQTAWWQHRRVWQPALVAAIGLLLAALIVPWRGSGAAQNSGSLTARALVQSTLDDWTAPPDAGAVHRQVWARTADDTYLTDVWLAGPDAAAHRVEVRHGSRLVEWQLADGKDRLDYAADPGHSSCPWRMDEPDFRIQLRPALTFRIPPEQQQAARQARLIHGAYGVGYAALQQALNARDLRSFGTRSEGRTTLVLLGYTDERTQPARQMLLHIDPDGHQLYVVQEVLGEGRQTQAQDVWRLQAQDEPEKGIPVALPRWPEFVTQERLLDPACPALNEAYVLSLSTLASASWQQWYIPQTLPPGITRAALITASPNNQGDDPIYQSRLSGLRIVFVGSNRWLYLSALGSSTPGMTSDSVQRGPWLVKGSFQDSGRWIGAIQRIPPPRNIDDAGRSATITAYGWTQDEIFALVDSLVRLDVATWGKLNQFFLDPHPQTPEVHKSQARASAALRPPPHGAYHVAATALEQ